MYDALGSTKRIVGVVRRGSRIPVRLARTDIPCEDGDPVTTGQWLETPGGFVCTGSGITVGGRPTQLNPRQRPIDLTKPLDLRYRKMIRAGVPRYERPVSDPQRAVETQTKAYFLARDAVITRRGQKWLRTVYGEYTPYAETQHVEPSRHRGVALDGHTTLPVAFVIGPEEGVTIWCEADPAPIECGRARKHRRFKPEGRVSIGLREYVRTRKGRLVPAEYVRIAEAISRPEDIPEDARWVHIDLDEQAFVAYEGDTPRYASLVSSGVAGRDTPDGLYQVQRKYITKTMRGPDETHERYRVEEIPWVMYYHGAYAVHGAYWHNQFGQVRSHGCTNLSPADAKWLFDWDQTEMPTGWHANMRSTSGLYFYFSRFEEPLEAGDAS